MPACNLPATNSFDVTTLTAYVNNPDGAEGSVHSADPTAVNNGTGSGFTDPWAAPLTTIYTSKDALEGNAAGNDSTGTGTLALPYATIQKGINSLTTAGDELQVRDAAVKNGEGYIAQENQGNNNVHHLFLTDSPKHVNLSILATLKTKMQDAIRANAKMVNIPNAIFALDGAIRQLTATHNCMTVQGPIDIQVSKGVTASAVGVYVKG